MNYLPFDLEIALKHPERLVTRDGRKISELHYFKTLNATKYKLVCIINADSCNFTKDGNFYTPKEPHPNDLFLLPEVKECWVNVYEHNGEVMVSSSAYKSRELALMYKSERWKYVKTIRITNEPE